MTHLFSRCISLLFVVILLGECAKKPPRQLPAYPLQPGSQWTYRELQVINGDSLWRRRKVQVLDWEKIRTDRGVTYPRGVAMEVRTDGRRVSTQHLAVDGDTVKMLHLRSAHGNLEIHFHPHYPEYVRLDSGAVAKFHYEAVRYDTSGHPLGTPEPFDLVITRRDTTGIKAGGYLYHQAELLDYFFPRTGVHTLQFFVPDTGRIVEYSPRLNINAKGFSSLYQLEEFQRGEPTAGQ